MVLEAKPSPHIVGREFVRQYYTLLHDAPDHLHRFYNQHSSFIHGGIDVDANTEESPVVIGQKNIHDKIQQLNFRDCHAKISHVDAQATLGDGVVVQVSGELSNDGHPMRRFTQTFVLACQSPKKYYVHNDIFRYQDVYSDEDEQQQQQQQQSVRSDVDEHEVNDGQGNNVDNTAIMIQEQAVFYPSNVGLVNNTYMPAMNTTVTPVNGVATIHDDMLKTISTQTNSNNNTAPPSQSSPLQMSLTTTSNNASILIEQSPGPSSDSPSIIPATNNIAASNITGTPNVPTVVSVASNTISTTPSHNDTKEYVEIETITTTTTINSVTDNHDARRDINDATNGDERSQSVQSNISAPKTYANLVKQGTNTIFMSAGLPSTDTGTNNHHSLYVVSNQQQQILSKLPTDIITNPIDDVNGQLQNHRNSSQQPQQQQQQRTVRERRTSNSNYPDSGCQLFLGNLPTRATEEELRQLFGTFGRIAELRIHTKSAQKNPTPRPVPNYGFITFEDQQSVNNLMNAAPIYYPVLNDPTGQKLNIERKIRKEGGGGGGGNQMIGQRASSNGQNNDSRGRNSNIGNGGMNRGGSGQRDRNDRDRGGPFQRQFNRPERGPAFGNNRR